MSESPARKTRKPAILPNASDRAEAERLAGIIEDIAATITDLATSHMIGVEAPARPEQADRFFFAEQSDQITGHQHALAARAQPRLRDLQAELTAALQPADDDPLMQSISVFVGNRPGSKVRTTLRLGVDEVGSTFLMTYELRDRLARLMMYRRLMREAWASLGISRNETKDYLWKVLLAIEGVGGMDVPCWARDRVEAVRLALLDAALRWLARAPDIPGPQPAIVVKAVQVTFNDIAADLEQALAAEPADSPLRAFPLKIA